MAFGNLVSDGSQIASGTYGAVYAFNLKSVLVKEIKQVQMQDSGVLSTPSTAPVETSTLFGYPESSSCPDFAFGQKGNILYLFIKSDVYSATSRLGIEFTRNAIPVQTLTGTYLDIPSDARILMYALAKKRCLEQDYKKIDFDTEQQIIAEKTQLGLV